jgi:integrase/recombinase XerD
VPFRHNGAVTLFELGRIAVRPFVAAHAVSGDAELRELGAGDVTGFMLAQSRWLAPKTVQRLVSALRSLLRFWHVQGLVSGPLDQEVPKVANR